MRRRKAQSPPRLAPRVRPMTGVQREGAVTAATRVQSAQPRLRTPFAPQPGEGHVSHLLSWQAGQKLGTLLRPFRKPDHAYKKSDLLRDPRAPGYNPKREQAAAVRELSRAEAERNTEGWLAREGQRRLLSASVQSRLGALAGSPVSELQTELHGRLREAIRRPRTSSGAYRSSWSHATETWDHVQQTEPEGRMSPVAFWNGVSSEEDPAVLDAQEGVPIKRVPRWRIALNSQGHADGDVEDRSSEDVGYMDKLYYKVTDVALDHKAQALHNEYKAGFCSKVGGNITKRLQVGTQHFQRQYATRQYEQRVRKRLGNLIYAIHAVFKQRRWVCRCKMVPLEEILREPFRYMLISLEQFDEYGRGDRELSCDEWQRVQLGQKLVGEMPEVVKMLEHRRVSEAVKYSRPTNLEEFPANGDWMNFMTTRQRMLEHAAGQAEASTALFPAPTLRETSPDGLPGGGKSWRRSSSEENSMMGSQSLQQGSTESGPRISVCDSNLPIAIEVDEMLTVDALEAGNDVNAVAVENAKGEIKGESEIEEEEKSQTTACVGGDADADFPALDAEKHEVSPAVCAETLDVLGVDEAHVRLTVCTPQLGGREPHVQGDDSREEADGLCDESLHTKVSSVDVAGDGPALEMTGPGHQTVSDKTFLTKVCLDDISDGELVTLLSRTASNMRVCDVAAAGSKGELNESSRESHEIQAQVGAASPDLHATFSTASEPVAAAASSAAPADADGDAGNDSCFERAISGFEVAISTPKGTSQDGVIPGFAQKEVSVAEDSVILDLNGYDIRLRLTLEDMLQHTVKPATGRVRNTKWLMATLNQLSADKLLADAGELGGLQPRMRLPAFTKKWLILRFGKNKFCEQQLADLIATMNALESKSVEVRMYSYAMRERFNAGQLALLLNIRSFARAMASAKTNRVQLKFAQRVALFALDFASPERVEKVLRRLQMKSGSSSQNANDSVERVGAEEGREEEKSVSVVDLLNIVLSAYGSAIHEFRMHLREEYEDLLEELARGQPYDGLKGRPLGSRVTFSVMSEFVSRHYDRGREVFESFVRALYVRNELSATSVQPSDVSKEDTDVDEDRLEKRGLPMLDLDSLIAIDDAVDLMGFDKRWDRLNQTDVSMVISDDHSALWAQQSVEFSSLKGTRQQYKAELIQIAKRHQREADRRSKVDEESPHLRLRSPSNAKSSFSSSGTF